MCIMKFYEKYNINWIYLQEHHFFWRVPVSKEARGEVVLLRLFVGFSKKRLNLTQIFRLRNMRT